MRIDPNSKVGQFLGHVLPGVMRPLRILWNEIIGFLFICLAVWFTPSAVRAWREFDQHGGNFFWLAEFFFIGLMLYFGLNSFLRARKISRS
jgi:hypothetical protein